MKKSMLVLLMCMVAAFSFAGGQADAGEEDVVLNYWTWHPSAELLQPILDDFESENPGITVNLTVVDAEMYQEKIPTALASGESLDVVGIQAGLMPSQIQGYLTPIEPYLEAVAGSNWENALKEKDIEICKQQTGGELFMIAMGSFGSAMGVYNVEIFDELGLSVPETYKEMVNVANAIRAEKPGVLPVVFAGEPWWVNEIVLNLVSQESEWWNEVRYDKGGRWDDPIYIQAVEDFVQMHEDGVFEDMTDIGEDRAYEIFFAGEAAIYYGGSWDAPILSETFRKNQGIDLENVGAMMMPVMRPGVGELTMRAFIELGLAIPEVSDHKEDAAKLIWYLVAGDGFDKLNWDNFIVPSKKGSMIPDSLLTSKEARDGWELIVSITNDAKSFRDSMSAFEDVAGQILIDIIHGADIQESCEWLQKEFTSGRY
ncbi:hypothetical protein ES707_04681 [subsurface metagenome]